MRFEFYSLVRSIGSGRKMDGIKARSAGGDNIINVSQSINQYQRNSIINIIIPLTFMMNENDSRNNLLYSRRRNRRNAMPQTKNRREDVKASAELSSPTQIKPHIYRCRNRSKSANFTLSEQSLIAIYFAP